MEVELLGPDGIAVDGDGVLYVAETDRPDAEGTLRTGSVRRVDATGTMAPVEGDPVGEGLTGASAMSIDADGRIYLVTGDSGEVRRRDPDGVVTTIAGVGAGPVDPDDERSTDPVDGQAATAMPTVPVDVTTGGRGGLYVATGDAVFEVTPEGTLNTVVGPDDRDVDDVTGIAADANGNLYVASSDDNLVGHVHKVTSDGRITNVAGSNAELSSSDDEDIGDGGPATEAVLTDPADVVVDGEGNVYVSEERGVRRIDPDGVITTVAESPREEREDEDGFVTTTYTRPSSLAVDDAGNLYFAEPDLHRVRVVVRAADISNPGTSPWRAMLPGFLVVAAAALLTLTLRWRQHRPPAANPRQ